MIITVSHNTKIYYALRKSCLYSFLEWKNGAGFIDGGLYGKWIDIIIN